MLRQYKETLVDTEKKLDELEKELAPYKAIYTDTKQLKSVRINAKEASQFIRHEASIYRSIRNELEFAICWMKNGHSPESKRGIERRASYQIEKPIDPLLMQRYFRSQEACYPWDDGMKEHVVTRSEKEVLSRAMDTLTDKEREVYLMFKGQSFSQYKIADMMNISRSSVKTMISRADKKIHKVISAEREGA
nr:sigma factor-like helix-turn-helix DNA-binding protein [Cytobacillus firmus]